MFSQNTYTNDIKLFEKILTTKAEELLSTESLMVIYIGRETCPFCRKFAKTLSGLVNDINTTIYYVDSEDYSDTGISAFRSKYSIRTVPGFIVSKNGDISVICDSSTTESVILDMIN